MKVNRLEVRGPAHREVEFDVRGEFAGTKFGHLWISGEGVSWNSEETGGYAVRLWEYFALMMAEKGCDDGRASASADGLEGANHDESP